MIPEQCSLQIMHFIVQALQGLVYATFTLAEGHIPHIWQDELPKYCDMNRQPFSFAESAPKEDQLVLPLHN